jgi:hypothetical protein
MLAKYNARSSRADKQQLLFATAMFTYNRGLFDKVTLANLLDGCSTAMDPILGCNLNGFAGHTQDVGKICHLIDRASEVYDYDLSKANIDWFVNKLEETYPYDSVADLYGSIDWAAIRSAVSTAFTILAQRRGGSVISFRYDFRPLLAVVRTFLPEKEELLGVTIQSIDDFYGNSISEDLLPLTRKADVKFSFVNTAGSRYDHELNPTEPGVATVPQFTTIPVARVPGVPLDPQLAPTGPQLTATGPQFAPTGHQLTQTNDPALASAPVHRVFPFLMIVAVLFSLIW